MKYIVIALVLALVPLADSVQARSAQGQTRRTTPTAQRRARNAGKLPRGRKAPKVPKRRRPVEK